MAPEKWLIYSGKMTHIFPENDSYILEKWLIYIWVIYFWSMHKNELTALWCKSMAGGGRVWISAPDPDSKWSPNSWSLVQQHYFGLCLARNSWFLVQQLFLGLRLARNSWSLVQQLFLLGQTPKMAQRALAGPKTALPYHVSQCFFTILPLSFFGVRPPLPWFSNAFTMFYYYCIILLGCDPPSMLSQCFLVCLYYAFTMLFMGVCTLKTRVKSNGKAC